MKRLKTLLVLFGAFFQLYGQQAECLAPAEAVSAMTPNSDYDINSLFKFDYTIQSTISGIWSHDVNSPPREGFFNIEYYVNTADGSMFFTENTVEDLIWSETPGGIEGVKIYGAVRMGNGQMVTYVYDSLNRQNRAITMTSKKTTEDLGQTQQQLANRFFSISPADFAAFDFESRKGHEPSTWAQRELDGWFYRGGLTPWIVLSPEDNYDITLHLAKESGLDPIATNKPFIGLLAGIMKNNDCNWLVVETTMELIYDEPEVLRETLIKVTKEDNSFNGEGYKALTLGASRSRPMTESQRNQAQNSHDQYMNDMTILGQQLVACGSDEACIRKVEKQMLDLEWRYQNAKLGDSGTGYEMELMILNDQMSSIEEQLIDKESQCAKINQRTINCANAQACESARKQLDQCHEQIRELKEQKQQLTCELAKLKGMEDMLEDCN